ncbi:F0F1 ATP synthase subunit A [Nonomuraea sp. NPDC050536]|uniref:F0F1 ATP synthase subunit A n=1 Tax=Nonomuraea sp. NPDC050536 TaxID=3364366 RepID=UPI0037CBC965
MPIPGTDLFDLPPLWDGAPAWLTKPVLLAVLAVVIICGLGWAAFARPRLVPRGLQNVGEYAYVFVRDQVARPFLGKDADRWMGFLLTLFLLTLTWNLMGVVPVIQFPVASHIAFPAVLAAVVYVIKLYLGFRHQGFAGFFRNAMFPPGLPKALALVLYAPLELVYIFVTAPFTHAVRLFANMFAGHMLLAFFSAVGFWFTLAHPTLPGFPVGVLGVLATCVLTAFEMFIQFLQAYLFTMLAAMYLGDAIHPAH